jgi:hypothetical protein
LIKEVSFMTAYWSLVTDLKIKGKTQKKKTAEAAIKDRNI